MENMIKSKIFCVNALQKIEQGMEPFLILRNHRSRMDSIAKIQRFTKENEESKFKPSYFWIAREHEIYVEILKLYCKDIQSKDQRKEVRIFAVMSQILRTRTPKQVKTHHQKMIKRWKDIHGIIAHSCSSYLQENQVKKGERRKTKGIQVEQPRTKVQKKVAKIEASESTQKKEEENKIEDYLSQNKVQKKAEIVGMVKQEVVYETYYPFLSFMNADNYVSKQYSWNIVNWAYEMTQPFNYYDGQTRV